MTLHLICLRGGSRGGGGLKTSKFEIVALWHLQGMERWVAAIMVTPAVLTRMHIFNSWAARISYLFYIIHLHIFI